MSSVLQLYGEIPYVELESDKYSTTARATFVDHINATEAAAYLDGATMYGRTVSVQLASHKSTSLGHGTIHDTDILIEFPCAYKTMYVGYAEEALAQAAIDAANNTVFKDAWITVQHHAGLPAAGRFTVRFWGLPPDTKPEELDKFGENQGVMFERPNYNDCKGSTWGLRQDINKVEEIISWNVSPPPYKKYMVRVWAGFETPQAAAKVARIFHGRKFGRFGNYPMYARHIKSLSYRLPADVFDSISSDIQKLRSSRDDDRGTTVHITDRRSCRQDTFPVAIKLASESVSKLKNLKTSFDSILKGEKVVENGEIVWNGFFTRRAGMYYVQELERKYPGLKVNRDIRRRTLALFGPKHRRNAARTDILAKVAFLRLQKTQTFPIPVNILGLFMSADLAKLQEEIGEENVTIDLGNRILSVRGDEEAYKVARLALMRARDRHHTPNTSRRQGSCPVCLDDVKAPVTLQCGHTWCTSCLHGYLKASIDSRVFPLTCLGNEASCTEHISLYVAQELLTPNEFDAVLKAAFLTYVQSHPLEFFYCPTPDCDQIYRKTRIGTTLQCPACLVRICATCHFEEHESGKCPDMDTEDQKKFDNWKTNHDVKSCPGCRAPIERTAGCNHMTCARCKTHICWACLATFEKGDEVYAHMNSVHGGIGFDEFVFFQ